MKSKDWIELKESEKSPRDLEQQCDTSVTLLLIEKEFDFLRI